jgi:hypothetical protein
VNASVCEKLENQDYVYAVFHGTHRSRPVDSDGNITRCSGTGLAFGVFFASGAGLLPRTGRLRDPMTASCGLSFCPRALSLCVVLFEIEQHQKERWNIAGSKKF